MKTKIDTSLIERIADFIQHEGVADSQTAWELAIDLKPLVQRLIEANRNVVTK